MALILTIQNLNALTMLRLRNNKFVKLKHWRSPRAVKHFLVQLNYTSFLKSLLRGNSFFDV